MRAALLLLLLAPALAWAQAGRFLLAAGEVTLVRGTQQIPAAAGTAVQPGDTIRVGPRSNVQLRMSDQSIISLRANTIFRIDEYVYSGRSDDTSRSIFSLVKGGMRTVSGAIARPSQPTLVQTGAKPEGPSDGKQTFDEKPRGDESQSKLFGLIRAPLRAVAGALTPTRHAVRVPTATIGIRGTHYTLVHCDNDCFEPRRTTVASLLAQSDAGSPGLGGLAPNGTYAGVTDGGVIVFNNQPPVEFGPQEFFYIASMDSVPRSLIGPPAFLYDRLDAQDRNRGRGADEPTPPLPRSGFESDGRPNDTPVPPAPPTFIVTEQRDSGGDLVVLGGNVVIAPAFALLTALTNASGAIGVEGAFIDASALVVSGGPGSELLTAFNVPAGGTVNITGGAFLGSTTAAVSESGTNALNAYWGTWSSGTIIDAIGSTVLGSGNKLHYMVGPNTPPEVIAAKSGAFPFRMIGGTTPTNNFLETATSMTGTTLTVDFTARTVLFPATTITFPSQPWTFAANTAPIMVQAGRGAFVNDSVTGSCGPFTGCSGTAVLNRTGIFMGPVGDHLGVAYQGHTTTGTANFQTTKIFTCAPSC